MIFKNSIIKSSKYVLINHINSVIWLKNPEEIKRKLWTSKLVPLLLVLSSNKVLSLLLIQEPPWVTSFHPKPSEKLSKSANKNLLLLQVVQLIVNIGKLGFLNKSECLNLDTVDNLQLLQLQE